MNQHILIVEDEPDISRFLTRGLAQHGFTTTSCTNGALALEILQNSHAENEIHLIISDIKMPVMDGISLALNVARDMPHIPLILMTGYAEQRERAIGLDNIVADIIQKPFELSAMVKSIQQNINQGAAWKILKFHS